MADAVVDFMKVMPTFVFTSISYLCLCLWKPGLRYYWFWLRTLGIFTLHRTFRHGFTGVSLKNKFKVVQGSGIKGWIVISTKKHFIRQFVNWKLAALRIYSCKNIFWPWYGFAQWFHWDTLENIFDGVVERFIFHVLLIDSFTFYDRVAAEREKDRVKSIIFEAAQKCLEYALITLKQKYAEKTWENDRTLLIK